MTKRLGCLTQLTALSILFLGPSTSGLLSAQESSCKITVPMTVYLPNGTLVRKLEMNQFVIKSKTAAPPIDSLTVDNGPRRIVFVVETGKHVSETVRKIEANVIAKILSDMRPEDSVALITSHGPLKEFRFSENRDNLTKAVGELANVPQGRNQSTGVLDSIQVAATWLAPHRQGDAIIVLTLGIEHFQSKAAFSKVRDSLTANGVRLFGFQFGEIVAGTYGVGVAPLPGGPGFIPSAYVTPNRESLNSLSIQTGGLVFIEPTDDPLRTYKLTPERLAVLENAGKQVYKAIREYYVLTLASRDSFEIDVSELVRAKIPNIAVTYPRKRDTTCADIRP
jgi:hypothetical protein